MLKLSKKLSEKSPAVLLAVLGLCLGRSCAEHVLSLPSKDASVVVVGRSAVNANGIEFDMPGVSINTRVEGATFLSLEVFRSGDFEASCFLVYVDGTPTPAEGLLNATFCSSAVSQNASSPSKLEIASGLRPEQTHAIVIFKTTEAMWNNLTPRRNTFTFVSLRTNDGAKFLAPELPSKRIAFLGDSITAGFCNLCQSDNTASTESFASSWPTLICNQMPAQCHTAAWSGYGMAMNCCGGDTLMSDVWKRTLASVPSDNSSDPHGTIPGNYHNFSEWVPDVVVVNLGTNDNLGARPELIPAYNATYLQLVKEASVAYGAQTAFFLACGPMNTAYCEQVAWVLEQLSALDILSYFLDMRGFDNGKYGPTCCGHPSAMVDRAIAQNATAFIKEKMRWA